MGETSDSQDELERNGTISQFFFKDEMHFAKSC
jgi:hypothetical protein